MRKKIAAVICAMLLGTAGVASAAPIFSDNFNTENGGKAILNYNGFTNWRVTNGTVDLIGVGSQWDFQPGNGLYVDLDGSTRDAGYMLSRDISIPTAGAYTLSFDLAGSHRTLNDERVDVVAMLGGFYGIYSVPSQQDFTRYNMDLFFEEAGTFSLAFQNAGSDNIGALLDNVEIAPVPEPGTVMLLGAGFLGLAIFAKRRKNV